MTVEEALEQLSTYGLNPKLFVNGEVQTIIGHLEVEMIEDGIPVLAASYWIGFEDNLWIATIDDPNTVLTRSTDLSEVVDVICDFYKLRDRTTSDELTSESASTLLRNHGINVKSVYGHKIWGNASRQVPTTEGFLSDRFCIYQHGGAWLGIHICPEGHNIIRYSKSLGDVVRAVVGLFEEQ